MALEVTLEDQIVGVLVFDGSPKKGEIKHKTLAAGVAVVSATGPPGPRGADGQSLIWRGEYDAGTTYDIHDAVSYLGSGYICIEDDTTDVDPITGLDERWDLFAKKGNGWRGGNGGPAVETGDQWGDYYTDYDSGVVYQLQGTEDDPESWFWGNRFTIVGADGADGANGVSAGIQMTYSPVSDPSELDSGEFGFSNVADAFFCSTRDMSSNDYNTFLATFLTGTKLYIQANDGTVQCVGTLTSGPDDEEGYIVWDFILGDLAGAFTAGQQCGVVLTPSGDVYWTEVTGDDPASTVVIQPSKPISLNDQVLFLRQAGDLNHSLRWGYMVHGVDGPLFNGFVSVGFSVGDATDGADVLVAYFDGAGMLIAPLAAADSVLTIDDTGRVGTMLASDLVGESAYDIAVDNGYEGTEEQWIDSIRGFYLADGPDDEPPEGTPDRTFVFERA